MMLYIALGSHYCALCGRSLRCANGEDGGERAEGSAWDENLGGYPEMVPYHRPCGVESMGNVGNVIELAFMAPNRVLTTLCVRR